MEEVLHLGDPASNGVSHVTLSWHTNPLMSHGGLRLGSRKCHGGALSAVATLVGAGDRCQRKAAAE
jgi:hypothetical protein